MTTRIYSATPASNRSSVAPLTNYSQAASPMAAYLAGYSNPVPNSSSVIQSTVGQPLSGGVGTYDIESDPAVAAARGLSARIRAQAQATALAKRTEAAIEYGSADGLQSALGKSYADVAAKAEANPFSVKQQQAYNYKTGLNDLEEGLNKANLFYSGYRGDQLGKAARGYELNQYNAANSFKALNSDISDNLANALMQADTIDMNALMASQGGGYGGDGGDNSFNGNGGYWFTGPGVAPGSLPSPMLSPNQVRNALGGSVPRRSAFNRPNARGAPRAGARIGGV